MIRCFLNYTNTNLNQTTNPNQNPNFKIKKY